MGNTHYCMLMKLTVMEWNDATAHTHAHTLKTCVYQFGQKGSVGRLVVTLC